MTPSELEAYQRCVSSIAELSQALARAGQALREQSVSAETLAQRLKIASIAQPTTFASSTASLRKFHWPR